MHGDDVEKFKRAVKEFELIGKHKDVIFRFLTSTGGCSLFRGYIARLGATYLIHCVSADHLRLIERKEQKIKALFSLMDSNSRLVTLVTDSSGTLVWASRGVQSVLGYTPARGQAGEGFSHPSDAHVPKESSSKYRRSKFENMYGWSITKRKQ